MPSFVFVILMAVVRGLTAALKRPAAEPQRGLCEGCAFVHMQYGASGRNAVFCTYRGGVREVRLNVLYCTDYRNRNAAPRLVRVGFAPEVQRAEAEA